MALTLLTLLCRYDREQHIMAAAQSAEALDEKFLVIFPVMFP